MPSTKAIAVAVTALAASGINAAVCTPETPCESYTVLDNPPSEATCGTYAGSVTGAVIISDTQSASFDDCATSCIKSDDCKILSYYYDFPGSEFYCRLYSEYTLTPSDESNEYYQRDCLGCNRGTNQRGRGGRGGRRR
ncbi:hypothetical protein G7Z17_g1317 [Cylindrodendrum hubeiense]|uniref:Apple domain-containing protein n=1 Tax=Cylindrodendrum hubeiense TaxID=595255 RepID=A0A9P5HEZ8_9HYPO|nr:hypothetical protein G7Z17_g1317 [Cylindrodendrum hubeiense]